MRNFKLVMILSVVVALGFLYAGCGNTEKIMSEMSGNWKSDQDSTPVKIQLSGKQKAIEIGGNTVPVTVNILAQRARLWIAPLRGHLWVTPNSG